MTLPLLFTVYWTNLDSEAYILICYEVPSSDRIWKWYTSELFYNPVEQRIKNANVNKMLWGHRYAIKKAKIETHNTQERNTVSEVYTIVYILILSCYSRILRKNKWFSIYLCPFRYLCHHPKCYQLTTRWQVSTQYLIQTAWL